MTLLSLQHWRKSTSVQFNHLFSDFACSKAPLNAPVSGKRPSTRQDMCGKATQVSGCCFAAGYLYGKLFLDVFTAVAKQFR